MNCLGRLNCIILEENMNRENLINYIKNKLLYLAYLVSVNGKLNQLSINSHCEQFYCGLFNLIFDYSLKDINTLSQKGNVEGIDLIDDINKIFIQVSSLLTTNKIEESLKKDSLKLYKGYHFKFISIVKEGDYYKNKSYDNPNCINFAPNEDLYDVSSIMFAINSLPFDKLQRIYDYVSDELSLSIDENKIDSDLTKIINSLAVHDEVSVDTYKLNSFKIEEKIHFNGLDDVEEDIKDKFIYYSKLNSIYKEYSNGGKDISNFVFTKIKSLFRKIKSTNSVDKFDEIIELVCKEVMKSGNFVSDISAEELYFYSQIIIVDSFIKCKIFKNPKEYNYVNA